MVINQIGMAPLDKPWQLIRDAVSALELQEKVLKERPSIELHSVDALPYDRSRCFFDTAMAKRPGVSTEELDELNAPKEYRDRLQALSKFESGDVSGAYDVLQLKLPADVPLSIHVPPYSEDRELFKKRMLNLADKLESSSP